MTDNNLTQTKLYINIGLVGHVANGKTTLVKCLTGVNTKRDSAEIKTGRTIKLGYANCLVWRCAECNKIQTTGQSREVLFCCDKKLEPEQYISFIDAPGHHSYVHTMIKGTAIIDCAIVVTDVRAETLQAQTLEHLAILETLNIRNILVVQNKIDLAPVEQVKNNYTMLRRELKDTVACDAPIIPISAQSNIGIENVQKYIYLMVQSALKSVRKFSHNIFTIIRSFDINRPNTDIEDLKGGVIGGTVTGEKGYQEGDIVEIRPGLKNLPIRTRIISIFSESKKCKDMIRGGLYGVGTMLDPSLTKSDRLVGCLMGYASELPEIMTEIDMKIFRSKNTPKIEEKSVYKIIIGSCVVKANFKKKMSPEGQAAWTAILDKPVCTLENKCLVYTETTELAGFGKFLNSPERRCGSQENPEEVSVPVTCQIPQTEETFFSLIPTLAQPGQDVKVTLPIPVMARENRNMIWTNVSIFCQYIHRESSHVCAYLKQELCMEASVCQTGIRLFKTKLNSQQLQNVLWKYIKENISCQQCHSTKTELRGRDIFCLKCKSSNK